jgi:hypothetical protein
VDGQASEALASIRRAWVLPLVLFLLFAIAGFVVANGAQARAEVLLSVNSTADDTSAAETVGFLVGSVETVDDAARTRGVSSADLRGRTTVAVVPDTQVISVTVAAPTGEQARLDAVAIGEAAVRRQAEVAEAQYQELREQGDTILTGGRLADESAEAARQAQVGTSIATRQDQALGRGTLLSLLSDPDQVTAQASVSPRSVSGLAGLGGLLIGLAACVVRGRFVGRVESAVQLQRVTPSLTVATVASIGDELSAVLARREGVVVVLGLAASNEDLERVAGALSDEARRRDVAVTPYSLPGLVLDGIPELARFPSREELHGLRTEFGGDVILLYGDLTEDCSEWVDNEAAGNVVLVVSRAETTYRMIRVAARSLLHPPVVVVT